MEKAKADAEVEVKQRVKLGGKIMLKFVTWLVLIRKTRFLLYRNFGRIFVKKRNFYNG